MKKTEETSDQDSHYRINRVCLEMTPLDTIPWGRSGTTPTSVGQSMRSSSRSAGFTKFWTARRFGKSALRERGIEGGCSLPRARLLASCSAALGWWIVSNFRQTRSRHMLTDTASPRGPASHTRGPSLGCSSKRSVSKNRSLTHIGLAQWCG